ncbi:glycosyltransferase [Desulfotignum phosphitoxidans]|uniref:Glycosyltransferase 2-like domain-containing protein n=1 Tax=Desulfotignum phosphitoxidans DSM 13687 TaxID=1286635 RepID=S0G516_9BACT|nr:glycosyltransferase [Desulfotignum phosphitoxidans]EMS80859.1 hypothetical protein Dpo_2c05640 [Desulfotignum phosphitoxidans DSM 13687]
MEIVFNSNRSISPKISIILLDWACRESFHILKYLNTQTVSRDLYEIIWIEYYKRKPAVISDWLEKSIKSGQPILDKWVIIGMADEVYYHKHVMYNLGIAVSRGDIITICDSDAVVQPTFIESIITFFDNENDVVLHLDQVRSNDRSFYPFNYPSIEQIKSSECINIIDGKPRGIVDRSKPYHNPNFGACFSALREDIIAIGGADEHIDYLGHICGPYDMTFRLVNLGKKEVWHDSEWLYHLWHPGQSGDNNFAGPHDGRHMSQTALTARTTGRVLPLVENQAIKQLRKSENKQSINSTFLEGILSNIDTKKWTIFVPDYQAADYQIGDYKLNMLELETLTQKRISHYSGKPFMLYCAYKIFILAMIRRLRKKISASSASPFISKSSVSKTGEIQLKKKANDYFDRFKKDTYYFVGRCVQCIDDLNSMGVKRIVLWGDRCVADILAFFSKKHQIKFVFKSGLADEKMTNNFDKIIIASFDDVERKTYLLRRIGIDKKNIVDLW